VIGFWNEILWDAYAETKGWNKRSEILVVWWKVWGRKPLATKHVEDTYDT